jgi:hypothetical protein
MKNSIGSLAALAAFAAPALVHATPAESDIRAASFENVSFDALDTTPVNLDIDGDGTNDFFVYGNTFGATIRAGVLNGTTITESPVTFGASFDRSTALQTFDESMPPTFEGYYGFDFVSGFDSQHHAAWVHFDFSGESPVVVNGGWEAESFFTSITVGAIPEPSAAGALTGVAALLGACGFRRRRTA